jgi:hypothetical protein
MIACDINSLRTASKCYDCLSSSEKQALKTQFLAMALKAAGGTDYTNINTLLSATACFACEPAFVRESMELAIWKDLATTLGAVIPASVSGQRALVNCAPCGSIHGRIAAQIPLLCQLNAKGF